MTDTEGTVKTHFHATKVVISFSQMSDDNHHFLEISISDVKTDGNNE